MRRLPQCAEQCRRRNIFTAAGGGRGGTHRNARHLERQLLTKGIGKRLVAIGYDQEGTRAADDVGAIPLVDMGLIARGYGQAVHGDPMRDGGVPGRMVCCSSAHSTTAISTVWWMPPDRAAAKASLSSEAAMPSRCSLKRPSSTEPETSTASTRATSASADWADAITGCIPASAKAPAANHDRFIRHPFPGRRTCRLLGSGDSRHRP